MDGYLILKPTKMAMLKQENKIYLFIYLSLPAIIEIKKTTLILKFQKKTQLLIKII